MQTTNPCRRLPAGTPKAIRMAAHRQKMMGKHFRNLEPIETALVKRVRDIDASINKRYRSAAKREAARRIIYTNQSVRVRDAKLKGLK